MNQLQKYTWLINTIRRGGEISLKELSDKWERATDYSDGKKLHRSTFNHWRDAIVEQFGIIIDCRRVGGYRYSIANPEDIDDDKLKKWMLDSYAVSAVIGENIALKDRILVDEIPSGREHLTTIIEAMKENRVVEIAYRSFGREHPSSFAIRPYCLKLFDNRWYVLARNNRDEIRLYGLDRIESVMLTDATFRLPDDFDAESYFTNAYGIVIGYDVKPRTILLRAYGEHKHYMASLPLHHSQTMIADGDEYADFELFVAPTYDFIMKLLQFGPRVEVMRPAELRLVMKVELKNTYDYYKND